MAAKAPSHQDKQPPAASNSSRRAGPSARGGYLPESGYDWNTEGNFGNVLKVIRGIMKLFSDRGLKARGVLMNFASQTLKPPPPRTDCPSARRHMRLGGCRRRR